MNSHVYSGSKLTLYAIMGSMLLCGVADAADTPRIGTKVGDMYPDFMLPKLDGTMGRLSDYRGKKVLLFHFASW